MLFSILDENRNTLKVYTVQEAAEKLSISTRAIQKRCLKDNLSKANNRYIITDEHINSWKLRRTQKEIKAISREPLREPLREPGFARSLEIRKENEALKNRVQELLLELEQYQVSDNERIEVFTHEEYNLLEVRLREWYSLQKDLNRQEESFKGQKKSLKDMLKYYKNQLKYQKEQSTRILDMHERLIETIQKQNTLTMQRNIIEAKDKDYLDENMRPR